MPLEAKEKTMNEQKNIQLVQDTYIAFGRGDIAAILKAMAHDIDWLYVGRTEYVPFAGPRHGHGELVELFTSIGDAINVLDFTPREFIAFNDKMLVLGHESAQVKATNRLFETEWAHLFTIRDGEITVVREFYDTATIAAAFRIN